ncbi:MAG TPA: LysR family transcriptional regulator [Burkholderiales bacterium]|nr:LysR family transcriptional regulator [Burkholderiales bacterium]
MVRGGRSDVDARGYDAPPMRFDLAELETFLAVAELGSFSLAAKKLHVSQPSVTSRVQRLEATLRVKLLVRTTRRVEPTVEGARLLEAAQQALSGLREVLREFQAAANTDRRRVVVAATPMVAALALPPIIQAYCEHYPDVQVKLLDLPYGELVSSLEAGTADIGVTVLDSDPEKFSFQLLAEEEILLVVPATHPLARQSTVTIDEIVPYPLMILARYTTLRDRLAEEYRRRNVDFHPLAAANLATLLGMLDADMGITFLPRAMVRSNSRRSRVALRLADIELSRRYGIVTLRKTRLCAAAQSFCHYLQDEFEKNLGAASIASS